MIGELTSHTKCRGAGVKSWRHLIARLLFLSFSLLVAVLLIERVRGALALMAWSSAMTAKGEVLEVRKLWPTASPVIVEFSNSLSHAVDKLPAGIRRYAGEIQCIAPATSGTWLRGSQQPQPRLSFGDQTNTWDNVEAAVTEAEP